MMCGSEKEGASFFTTYVYSREAVYLLYDFDDYYDARGDFMILRFIIDPLTVEEIEVE